MTRNAAVGKHAIFIPLAAVYKSPPAIRAHARNALPPSTHRSARNAASVNKPSAMRASMLVSMLAPLSLLLCVSAVQTPACPPHAMRVAIHCLCRAAQSTTRTLCTALSAPDASLDAFCAPRLIRRHLFVARKCAPQAALRANLLLRQLALGASQPRLRPLPSNAAVRVARM